MTAQDIINEVRGYVQETDPNNTHRSDALILGDINSCTLALCSGIKTLPKEKHTSYVAADTLTIADDILRIDYASISDGTTKFPLTTIDFPNFSRLNPNWENAADGKPSQLVRMTDLDWMMWPNPDATWLGKSLTLVGSTIPTPLTSATSSPALSVSLHPCYAHFCAWIFFLILNDPERAAIEYEIFNKLRKLNTSVATSTTGSFQSFKIGSM